MITRVKSDEKLSKIGRVAYARSGEPLERRLNKVSSLCSRHPLPIIVKGTEKAADCILWKHSNLCLLASSTHTVLV